VLCISSLTGVSALAVFRVELQLANMNIEIMQRENRVVFIDGFLKFCFKILTGQISAKFYKEQFTADSVFALWAF
jgi:hypothetical protein